MPQARINGIDIYFERHGEAGEPLVFIHGYTGDISDWRFQIEASTPTNRASYTIEQMALDAEALAIEAGFERYHLVGHSMGGAIAQEIALASPGRLLSLTLEDTAYSFDLSRNEMIMKLAAIRKQIAEHRGWRPLPRYRRRSLCRRTCPESARPRREIGWRACRWTGTSARKRG